MGVDPGYRNLGICAFDYYPSRVAHTQFISAAHADVGYCETETKIVCKLHSYLDDLKPFEGADYVVIESQMMGKHTKPRNQGIAWLLATMALVQSPNAKVLFLSPRSKFSTFSRLFTAEEKKMPVKQRSILLARRICRKAGTPEDKLFKLA